MGDRSCPVPLITAALDSVRWVKTERSESDSDGDFRGVEQLLLPQLLADTVHPAWCRSSSTAWAGWPPSPHRRTVGEIFGEQGTIVFG